MAICRIEKVKNFTVMSNYHLDDIRLSLKSIGLLSKMLRLPDDWDFSIKGLTSICRDGADSIASALKELESFHYIKREQERDSGGHVGKMIYFVYEIPYDVDRSELNTPTFTSVKKREQSPQRDFPVTVNPVTVNPVTVEPDTDLPNRGNPAQINTYTQPSTNIPSTQQLKTQPNNNENTNSVTVLHPSISNPDERKTREDRVMEIKERIGYAFIVDSDTELDDRLENDSSMTLEEYDEKYIPLKTVDMVVDLMADIYDFDEPQIKVAGRFVSPQAVIRKFELLDSYDLKSIFQLLNSKPIKNRRAYALAVIMNF